MATWQPPIPQGALYSKPARDLGAALALLGWCYDAVQRDGWLSLSIKEAAGAMDEPYHTVKKWWGKLRDSEFFTEVIDHGRDGFKVRFADEWLDWRILSTRSVKNTSRTAQVPDTVLEVVEDVPQGLLKDCSRSDEGPDPVLEKTAYKEDKIQESDHGAPSPQAASVAPPVKARKPRGKTTSNRPSEVGAAAPAEAPTPLEIRQAYGSACDVDLAPGAKPPAKMILLLNSESKALWAQQQARGMSVAATVRGIRETAAFTRATDRRFKDPASRLPLGIIRENWTAAARWAKERVNGVANGHVPHVARDDAGEYATEEQWQAFKRGGAV